MFKEKGKTPEEVYDDLMTQGAYEEAYLDLEEIKSVKKRVMEDYLCCKEIKTLKHLSYNVIFNCHYDVFRELCDLLLKFKKIKISNHRGAFAALILKFSELELDWDFLESMRNVRNYSKYQGQDVPKETWNKIELQMNLYISALAKEIESKLS